MFIKTHSLVLKCLETNILNKKHKDNLRLETIKTIVIKAETT